MMCIIFVFLSYLGCWISPAAAPARVALGIITVLVVTGQLASVTAKLPPLSYGVWLVDFQFGCLLFNIVSFVLYAVVNFGQQQDGKLK